MIKRFKFEEENIILLGDIHGEFRPALANIERMEIEKSLIIQLGDFGTMGINSGYHLFEFENLNNKLKKNSNTMIVIRGNHDNPEYFNGDFIYSNLKLVPDYSFLETKKGNILCIGGAASIDKDFREEGISWFNEEIPIYDINALTELESVSIDYIVAHSNPKFCDPRDKAKTRGWNISDEVQEWLDHSRKILFAIYVYIDNLNTLKAWYNGHYHWSKKETIKGVDFITLDVHEFKELD